MSRASTPTLLLILDGWGQAAAGPGNAVSLARTPTLDNLLATRPTSLLLCSGRAVGLPDGFMGNSEVGHMNIGAGRIVYQDMTRIDIAIEENVFASNPVLVALLAKTRESGGVLHLMGLLSDGGVHSHIQHLFALLDAARTAGVPARVHCFMDGRDTEPHSGIGFLKDLLARLSPSARIAGITGRYYAMDRDKRWERVQKAWEALVRGKAPLFPDPVAAIEDAYAAGESDEFVSPRLVASPGESPPTIKDGDAVFFFNFRADRARELARCLHDPVFAEFDRGPLPRLADFATMTSYDPAFSLPSAFTRQNPDNGLGEVLSLAGLTQLRIAETEKYAHVTYFFNGGREDPLPGEDRCLVPSPRDVATYDLKPEMSVREVTANLLRAWNSNAYPFLVCNFANMDMVGHTGIIPAVIAACEAVDACLARILAAVAAKKGRLILTADHGNADEMLTPEGSPQTAHSKNPVALVLVDPEPGRKLRPHGKLADIAPTILRLWGLPVPPAMTGQSLCLEDSP
ncbi:MAG: 2,3-bisphosphoglycerate-independent phosphoglycerate mutase [Desulfovibrio sp.]|jgi:2,3-bisphosphoglycerate-independent phosphoglycerate mutase|nr:2,3-bisphosphoglycerate-independent phosphoglycerate mutase [Desulfovibrio sp.]